MEENRQELGNTKAFVCKVNVDVLVPTSAVETHVSSPISNCSPRSGHRAFRCSVPRRDRVRAGLGRVHKGGPRIGVDGASTSHVSAKDVVSH